MRVTVEEYFAGWPELENRHDLVAIAEAMLNRVNGALDVARADAIELNINPSTGTLISGQRNGGIRPVGSTVGAKFSKHQSGHAIDIYDPHRTLAQWCWTHRSRVRGEFSLCMENFRWTPTWVHFQDVPPGSGSTVFIPNLDPPLAPLLKGQDI